ncbi:MAG: hypothetical protein AAB610_00085 [Patescibacteria group bacterium]
MKENTKFYITLTGKINIPELEISQDVAAKIIRLIVPLSSNDLIPDEEVSNFKSIPNDTNLNTSLTAKHFMSQKQPKSDMERVACLAYYLAHYKNIGQFKTIDLTHLNAEAAQPKFSNASVAVANSTSQQYLVPAGNGKKQITVRGEALVAALPDRAAVKNALDSNPSRGNKRKNISKKNK